MTLAGTGGSTRGSTCTRLPVVAIDGPAGAGKSTLARRVAERAGLVYVDTGAMYRAVAYGVLRSGCATEPELDASAVAAVAEAARIDLQEGPGGTRVLLDGEDVTAPIREPAVERLVPRVASLAAVRRALVPQQRRMAYAGGVVLDGRDIGTTVLPDADCKFFVTAAFAVRVERRYRQLRRRGLDVDRHAVARDLRERDAMDSERSIGPMVPAPDAVRLDTTYLRVEDAVDLVLARCGLQDGATASAGPGREVGGGAGEP